MRVINYIVLHCTATRQDATVESILKYWKEVLGWRSPGYHYLIEPNGKRHNLQPIEKLANGVRGYNKDSIHISYIGGIDEQGQPSDNRTPEQVHMQIQTLIELKAKFPNAIIKGHRDFPNVDKACPSFNVKHWLKCVGF